MYSDPSKIRRHIVKLRLSDDELNQINSYIDELKQVNASPNAAQLKRAALLRKLIMAQVTETCEGPQQKKHRANN